MDFKEKSNYIYNGETVEYHYSPTATYMEQIKFVKSVGDAVVNENGYIPLLSGIMSRLRLVQMFTDIDMNQFNDDEGDLDLDLFDKFDTETQVSAFLYENIGMSVIVNLTVSTEDYIAHKAGISKDNISLAIIGIIRELANKFQDIDAGTIVSTYLNSDEFKNNIAKVTDKKNEQIRDLTDKLNAITAKNVLADNDSKVVPIKTGK